MSGADTFLTYFCHVSYDCWPNRSYLFLAIQNIQTPLPYTPKLIFKGNFEFFLQWMYFIKIYSF